MKNLSYCKGHYGDVAKYTPWSLQNCHAKDLYSIVLEKNSDGSLLRMFHAGPNHDLWKNMIDSDEETLGLAIHSHHCDIEILGVSGEMHNLIYEVNKDPSLAERNELELNSFKYTSSILQGKKKAKFVKQGFEFLYQTDHTSITENVQYKMAAHQMHTVYVEKGKTAAWLILEGKEDPDYTSVCYSNDDLENFPFEEYYLPADETEVAKILYDQEFLYHAVVSKKTGVVSDCVSNGSHDDSMSWHKNGRFHRETGPAILFRRNGSEWKEDAYFLEGRQYSLEEYWNHPLMVEKKVNKILK